MSKNEGRKIVGGIMAPKFFAPHFSTDSFTTKYQRDTAFVGVGSCNLNLDSLF